MSTTPDAQRQKALSREEAGQAYGVSYKTIERAINSGQLPAKRVGRLIRIDQQALDDWFRALPDV